VLHFCGLGYSRAGDKPRPEGGATSDHWIDLEKLTFEPQFERYVRDAFAPVGVCLDYWGQDLTAGGEQEYKVVVTNDLPQAQKGRLQLRLVRDGQPVALENQPCGVPALGSTTLTFSLPAPSQAGDYVVVAELTTAGQPPVRSERDAKVIASK
jgi:hypothetical protein